MLVALRIGIFDLAQLVGEEAKACGHRARHQRVRRVAAVVGGEREETVGGEQECRAFGGGDVFAAYVVGGAGIGAEDPLASGVQVVALHPQRRKEFGKIGVGGGSDAAFLRELGRFVGFALLGLEGFAQNLDGVVGAMQQARAVAVP